jgi:hypothetical protein
MPAGMADVLLILHFFGLMLVAGGGLGSVVALASVKPASRQKGGSGGKPGRAYARVSIAGLMFLWPTGIVLLVTEHDGAALGAMFWMKMVFAGLLTFAAITVELIYAGRSKQTGALLASLGPLAGLSALAAVVFSVLAFH